MTDPTPYLADISLDLATQAHSGTSWSPERRGPAEQAEYANTLAGVHDTLQQSAIKGHTLDLVQGEFDRFRAGYRKRFNAYLASRTRIVSTMIAGGSNFPAARMNRRSDVSHKRLTELLDYQKRAVSAACHRLRPDLRPIMSGDANAIERLREKLVALEAEQERMKAINATIRKHKKHGREHMVKALQAIGIKEALAIKLTEPDTVYGLGVPSFDLTNRGANIRTTAKRLAHLERQAEIPTETIEAEDDLGGLEINHAENRVRITFPGKPDEATRSRLKSNGFRWTPSLGVWQAYVNAHTIQTARDIVKAAAQ